jgi:hypothetical protein
LAGDVLLREAAVFKVGSWQFQLWLGLRAVALTIRVPLCVTPHLIEQSLQSWRFVLAETEETGTLIEQSVSSDMVGWLEHCGKSGQGILEPAPWIAIAEP